MDPTNALDQIKKLMTDMERIADGGGLIPDPDAVRDDLGDLCDTWAGLDDWLRKEGCLPAQWQRGRPPTIIAGGRVVAFVWRGAAPGLPSPRAAVITVRRDGMYNVHSVAQDGSTGHWDAFNGRYDLSWDRARILLEERTAAEVPPGFVPGQHDQPCPSAL